jgi:hypothetical protein
MSNINQILNEIKKKCPDQSSEIDRLRLNIDGYTLFKPIKKNDIKISSAPKIKTVKKPIIKPITKPTKNKFKIGSKVSWKQGRKILTGTIVNITQKNFIICCKPNSKSNYRISKELVSLIDENILPQKTIKLLKKSDKKTLKKSDKKIYAIPFSSIQGCGEINFTKKNAQIISNDSFLKKSKHFEEISTAADGNCGYHSIIQGLIESYYILGDKSNNNLKQFIRNIKEKLNLDPKQIVLDNRKNNKITIPREVINHFREFILDVKAPSNLRVPMPDGTVKHIFERENEVAEYPYDGDKKMYLKTKKDVKIIKDEKENNKKIIDSIKGGIKLSGSINSQYWLREEVLSGIFSIFNIPIYTFLKYNDELTGLDKVVNLLPKECKNVENCGHIIFMVNDGNHFNYITTNIQGYNNNILKCLGLDEKSVSESLESNESSSESNVKKSDNESFSLKPLTSMVSSIDSTSEGDLDDIDYNKNPKLYEQELYKILRKKMPNAKDSQIKLKFTEEINKLKSKYKK